MAHAAAAPASRWRGRPANVDLKMHKHRLLWPRGGGGPTLRVDAPRRRCAPRRVGRCRASAARCARVGVGAYAAPRAAGHLPAPTPYTLHCLHRSRPPAPPYAAPRPPHLHARGRQHTPAEGPRPARLPVQPAGQRPPSAARGRRGRREGVRASSGADQNRPEGSARSHGAGHPYRRALPPGPQDRWVPGPRGAATATCPAPRPR
jgi:hypothetical protein